jgi:hypothetical protein
MSDLLTKLAEKHAKEEMWLNLKPEAEAMLLAFGRELLSELMPKLCTFCWSGVPMSSEADLKLTHHNYGTDAEPDYRFCQSHRLRSLAGEEK